VPLELADLFGVTVRAIQKFSSDWGMPKNERNTYPLKDCVRWYLDHNDAKGKTDDKEILEERRLLVRAQRQRHELEIERRRDELVDRELVGQMLNELSVIFATQLEGLGARSAAELAGMGDTAEIQRKLLDECRSIRDATAAKVVEFASAIGGGRHIVIPAKRKRGRVGRPRKSATA